jgi:hypothetical protein
VDTGDHFKLNYHRLLAVIILVAIVGYFINDYWWLMAVILLMAIVGFFFGGH